MITVKILYVKIIGIITLIAIIGGMFLFLTKSLGIQFSKSARVYYEPDKTEQTN